MSEILSNEEIDALLAHAGPDKGESTQASTGGRRRARSVTAYDLTRPNRLSREQLQTLQRVHESAAQALKAALTNYLRLAVSVEVRSLEHVRFETYLTSLPDPHVIHILKAPPFHQPVLLTLDHGTVFAVVDRLLGGTGKSKIAARELTDIETSLLDGLIKIVFRELKEGWKSVLGVDFEVERRESVPHFARVYPGKEVVLIVTFGIGGDLTAGDMKLCISFSSLEPHLGRLASQVQTEPPAAAIAEKRDKVERTLRGVATRVEAVLGESTLRIRELMALAPGDVVLLRRGSQEPLELRIGGRPKFLGQAGVVGGRYGFKITGDLEGDRTTRSRSQAGERMKTHEQKS
jgi:flagellar motor switch protein FliM